MKEIVTDTLEGNSKAGFATTCGGGRLINQDRAMIVSPWKLEGSPTTATNSDNFIMSVFDGHGTDGEQMAEFVANNLSTMLARALEQHHHPTWDTSKVTDALTTTFRQIHNEGPPLPAAGSTASGALRLGDRLYLFNVGDSMTFVALYDPKVDRAIIVHETKPHKPDDANELARIVQHGGVIKLATETQPSARIILCGGKDHLAMSRSLGDRDAVSSGVIPDPDVTEIDLSTFLGKNLFVVAMTDGLFDAVSPADVANDVGRCLFSDKSPDRSVRKACEHLLDRATDHYETISPWRDYGDDIAVAVHIL